MFTGIVTDVGSVLAIEQKGDTRIEIETAYDTDDIDIGASIACSGPCLTVIEKGAGWFAIEASAETLDKTALGDWTVGTRVNLERAMRTTCILPHEQRSRPLRWRASSGTPRGLPMLRPTWPFWSCPSNRDS